ncbi:cytochrome c family protein [Limimaricola hongkongensis DSM 17492]|uniref:Cytochrome c family protein n=2 Tax=Limimaricola hongkongensis TaxID=278132 RepID=A0A017HE25_9RHOB|nr:cytochrome c family protein [Limimaricola hongkongensis DSM 17492]
MAHGGPIPAQGQKEQIMTWIITAAALSAAAVLAACAMPEPEPELPSGRTLFMENCASCHGAGGRGDGPMARDLPRAPTDLTRLSRRGQAFPTVHVMSYIDGYFRQDDPDQVMPEFSELFTGPTLHVDTGDGLLTPTPQPLVALSAYLEAIQEG